MGEKSTLATFFYVKKVYDSIWHARLVWCSNILKTFYLKDVFVLKNIELGIPQGSVISPVLFTILIHKSPKSIIRKHIWYNMQMTLLFGLYNSQKAYEWEGGKLCTKTILIWTE